MRKLGLCILTISAIAAWCPPGFSQTLDTNQAVVLNLDKLKIELAEIQETTWYGSKYYSAPITVPIDVYQKLKKDRPIEGILREDGGYLIGWAAIVAAGKFVERQYAISVYDFNRIADNSREAAALGERKPIKILFVADGGGIFNAMYEVMVSKTHPNFEITKIIARSSTEALAKLRQLPQDAQFDRIDWSVHGAPGEVQETMLTALKEKDLRKIPSLNLIRADGELRMLSCSIAQNGICKRSGETFVSELGRVFLPRGGSVFASTKNVNVVWYDNSTRSAVTRGIETYSQGPGHLLSLHNLLFNPLKALPLDESYKYDVLEIKRVEIGDTSCPHGFAQLIKWHSR